jgi:hypothetical protein
MNQWEIHQENVITPWQRYSFVTEESCNSSYPVSLSKILCNLFKNHLSSHISWERLPNTQHAEFVVKLRKFRASEIILFSIAHHWNLERTVNLLDVKPMINFEALQTLIYGESLLGILQQ